ncbi:MAG: pyruvate dehydrogenase (acetyl-transferring), homodimeric type, partial [Kerstersia sp.]
MTQSTVLPDVDPQETREWLEALEAVVAAEGRPRAHYLIDQLTAFDAERHGGLHGRVTTPYVNTISRARQPAYPGNLEIEQRINAYIRWNA